MRIYKLFALAIVITLQCVLIGCTGTGSGASGSAAADSTIAEATMAEQERAEQQRLEQEKAEQERLEQEKAEQQRLEEEKAAQERLEQQKLEQESAEQERLEQKFAGTYTLIQQFPSKAGGGRFTITIVVLNDGRCITVSETFGGEKRTQFIGNISPISNNAFRILGTRAGNLQDWYRGDKCVSSIQGSGLEYREVVFDKVEGKIYQSMNDYNNRDISDVETIPMTYSKSTSY